MEDASQAMRSLNGKRIGCEQIRVDFLRSQSRREQWPNSHDFRDGPFTGRMGSSDSHLAKRPHSQLGVRKGDGQPSKVLWVGYPPSAQIDEQMLHNAMILFGEIENIKSFPSRHYAFVEFRSVEEARCAKEGLQGRLFNDPRISIMFSSSELAPGKDYSGFYPGIKGPGPDVIGSDHAFRSSQMDMFGQNHTVTGPLAFSGIFGSDVPIWSFNHQGPNWRKSSPSLPSAQGLSPPVRQISDSWDIYDVSQFQRDAKRSRIEASLPIDDASFPLRDMDDLGHRSDHFGPVFHRSASCPFLYEMSFAIDSPVHSHSSDDFAALIDAELEVCSSGTSPDGQDNEEEEVDVDNDDDSDDNDDNNKEDGDNDDLNYHRNKRCKTEKLVDLEEPQGSTSQGLMEETLEVSLKKDLCTHPGSFGQMCIRCGERVDGESGVTFGYIHKGLRLGNDEIDRLRSTDMKKLLLRKKLYLVLDLDHTLLNSTQLNHLTPEEEYLKAQCDSLQDVSKGSLFMLNFMNMMTKLRPLVRTFLKEASEMFEMYIYTMGDRRYALEMAKLLDPHKEYFHDRVISRDDGTLKHQKGLDVVLGQDSAVVILDDTENAWMKHKDNLILMDRYHFFASSCDQFGFKCKSLSQLKSDESEPDGALASVLIVLKQIHHIFFNGRESEIASRDVRQVLKTVRKKVLKDCKIVFSRVFPTKSQAANHPLWKMAEELGATCSTKTDSSITHVVSVDAGTEKSRWAVKENKFLVDPRWIHAANFLWQKHPEENFPVVSQTKNQ